MLIQITNQCFEECEYCLQCSSPQGEHMHKDTFVSALAFVAFMHTPILVISGGEPTLNPNFKEFCQYIDSKGMNFTICSNGTFVIDDKRKADFEEVVKLKHCLGAQIYTNKDFYKSYDLVIQNQAYYNSLKGVKLDLSPILNMQDLGRAVWSEKAQRYIDNHNYTMSCVNMALLTQQAKTPQALRANYATVLGIHHPCKPLIDYMGNVHMSESICCPSVGNVDTDYHIDILKGMLQFKPCMKCGNSRRIYQDKYYLHRQILGINEERN